MHKYRRRKAHRCSYCGVIRYIGSANQRKCHQITSNIKTLIRTYITTVQMVQNYRYIEMLSPAYFQHVEYYFWSDSTYRTKIPHSRSVMSALSNFVQLTIYSIVRVHLRLYKNIQNLCVSSDNAGKVHHKRRLLNIIGGTCVKLHDWIELDISE